MKTCKRISAIVLALVLVFSMIPTAFGTKSEKQSIIEIYSSVTGKYHDIPVIYENNEIFAEAESYCEALEKDLIQNAWGWWLLPGAGDRQLAYHFDYQKWLVQSNLGELKYAYAEISGIGNMIDQDGILYFPLLSAAKELGVSILQSDDHVLFYVPNHTVLDVLNTTYKAFDSDNPFNVTTWKDEDDSPLYRGWKNTLVVLDVAFDIIGHGKIDSMITGDYLEDATEDALLKSMSGTPMYDAQAIADRWSNFDTVMSVIGDEFVWNSAYYDFGHYFVLNDPCIEAATNRITSGALDLADIMVDYVYKSARLMSLTDENINHAKNVFCNSTFSKSNNLSDHVEEIADQYAHGIDNLDFMLNEGIEAGFESIVEAAFTNGNPFVVAAKLAMDFNFIHLERIWGYEYGASTAISSYVTIQNQIRANYFKCYYSGDTTAESLRYMLDCALYNAQVKVASVDAVGSTIDLGGNGLAATLYRELASINLADVMLSIPENAEDTTTATNDSLAAIMKSKESNSSSAHVTDMEYGAILTELEAMGEIKSAFLSDCDGDGYVEFLAEVTLPGEDTRSACIIADANDGAMEISKPSWATESINFVCDPSSGQYILSQSFPGASGQYYYYYWSGQTWENLSECSYSGGEFVEAVINGVDATEAQWKAYTEGLIRDIPSDDGYAEAIINRFISGDSDALIKEVNNYACIHSQLSFKDSGDIDMDGLTDIVYLFTAQANPIFVSNRSEVTLSARSYVETAVVVFTKEDGILIQSICINSSPDVSTEDFRIEGNIITQVIAGTTIQSTYVSTGTGGRPAFVPVDTTDSAGLTS